jgi:[acyl-carrier-protein] S-malonyltransferase
MFFPDREHNSKAWGRICMMLLSLAQELFQKANAILGFDIADVMFNGTDEDLKKTEVTQPAVFIHSVVSFLVLKQKLRKWLPVIR